LQRLDLVGNLLVGGQSNILFHESDQFLFLLPWATSTAQKESAREYNDLLRAKPSCHVSVQMFGNERAEHEDLRTEAKRCRGEDPTRTSGLLRVDLFAPLVPALERSREAPQ
jgi:hypothetical protein